MSTRKQKKLSVVDVAALEKNGRCPEKNGRSRPKSGRTENHPEEAHPRAKRLRRDDQQISEDHCDVAQSTNDGDSDNEDSEAGEAGHKEQAIFSLEIKMFVFQ